MKLKEFLKECETKDKVIVLTKECLITFTKDEGIKVRWIK